MTDLLEIHLRTSSLFDADGNMTVSNCPVESDRRPCPACRLTWTSDRWLIRFTREVSAGTRRDMENLVEAHWPFADDEAPMPEADVRRIFESDVAVHRVNVSCNHIIAESTPVDDRAVFISRLNMDRCARTYPWVAEEIDVSAPLAMLVIDGEAVSICHTVRRSEWAVEAGVDTLEAHRGRGYAGAVTSLWAAAIRAEGLLPFYSFTARNAASRRVVEKLGAARYATDLSVRTE